jgi:putative nucleotidyltransferase with HDIG domain
MLGFMQSEATQHRGKRLAVGLSLVLALALFWHFREMPAEQLTLGTPADRYIIAQVDFSFPDIEETALLRQEAVRDMGSIYKMNPRQIQQVRTQFDMELMNNQAWRQDLEKSTFEEIHGGVDVLTKALQRSRYADARAFQKMKELKFRIADTYLIQSKDLANALVLPQKFWQQLQEKAFAGSKYQAESIQFIVDYFQKQTWNLEKAKISERNLSRWIEQRIPEQFTFVEAGTQLISPREVVTPVHLEMLKAMDETLASQRPLWDVSTLFGSLLFAFLFTGLGYLYLRIYQKQLLDSLQKLTLLVCIVILTLLLAKGAEFFILHQNAALIDQIDYPIFVPFATILICILVGFETSFFVSAFLTVILGLCLTFNREHFLIINFTCALIAMMATKGIHKRREVFAVCGKTWLFSLVIIGAFALSQETWQTSLLTGASSSFLCLLLTAILVVGLLPILEALFHVVTDMTLMEYMDPNHELLRRLSLEAPGTYQHCLVVGNLAESGARAIGADGLFCRVVTLYHDIGKLFNPHYFTENQLGGFNIHQLLTPVESAQVIIAHVPEGESLARKKGLPQSFIDIIREHHGTTLVYYFYCKQVELVGGDTSLVDERLFRYPGPKPHSKESAIIMMADTVEAASRSLEVLSEESLTAMADKLIAAKAADGQFDECQLTFEELGIVKKAIIKALLVSSHARVKYPTRT